MGSFIGHMLPGTFFFLFGLWWCMQTFRRYFQSISKPRQNRRGNFVTSPTFPVHTSDGTSYDIASYLAVVCSVAGMLGELVYSPYRNHHLYVGNMQHATMYFFFGISAAAAFLLPKLQLLGKTAGQLVYLLLSLAFLVEGLLFTFHLFGRMGVDVMLHTLLVYTTFTTALVTLLELRTRDRVLLPLSRAYLTLLQGTWFMQAAFWLYPPLTDPWGHHHTAEEYNKDHDWVVYVTCAFTWHMAGVVIGMFVIGILIGFCFKRRVGEFFVDCN